MSIIGSQVAAGVAQTAVTAQQAAQQRDRQTAQSSDQARQLQRRFKTNLRGLGGDTEAEDPAHLSIDGQLPEHQGRQDQTAGDHVPAVTVTSSQQEAAPENAVVPPPDAAGLYRHLDVQA